MVADCQIKQWNLQAVLVFIEAVCVTLHIHTSTNTKKLTHTYIHTNAHIFTYTHAFTHIQKY